MASESMKVCLHVLKKVNKSRYDTYAVKDVPLCENIKALKEFLLQKCQEELLPAKDTSFHMGYYGDSNKKFTISSPVQLAEAMSLVKKGWITLWVDPHSTEETPVTTKCLGKKEKV